MLFRSLAVIRSMSLNQLASDPRTINAAGQATNNNRAVINYLAGDDLIAMPDRSN